jgi:acyl carrier protein
MSSIEREVVELVGLQMGIAEVRAQDRILEDLGAESMDIVNLLATVEERFGMSIGEPELLAIRTPADLANLVSRRRNASGLRGLEPDRAAGPTGTGRPRSGGVRVGKPGLALR